MHIVYIPRNGNHMSFIICYAVSKIHKNCSYVELAWAHPCSSNYTQESSNKWDIVKNIGFIDLFNYSNNSIKYWTKIACMECTRH